MAAMPRIAGKISIALVAGSCGLLVLGHPDWRLDLQAQDYEPEACLTAAEAVAAASDTLRVASEGVSHRTEFVTVIAEDSDGCHHSTNFVQGREEFVDYSQGEDLLDDAERRGWTPVVTLHTHNYPSGSEYDPGLTGIPGDEQCQQNPSRCSGDAGFADKNDIPIIAIDVGPEAQPCAHGYNPETGFERTVCAE
jgi:hypothetical protein